jgi:caffeoyl-CoA O-methyltransferase
VTATRSDVPVARPVTPASILAADLERLVRRLDELGGVDPELDAGLRAAAGLASGLDPYLSRCTTPESPALARLDALTRAHDWGGHGPGPGGGVLEQEMLSGHVEGQALKMLVHLARAQRVLEIGMFTGYSALAMAEALPDDGRVVACEIDAGVAAFAERAFRDSPSGSKIQVRVGPARTTLAELAAAGEVFDLVFLDADKAGYTDYLTAVLDTGLLAAHGVVCVDNTLMQGQPWLPATGTPNGDAIARFNEAVAADPRVEQVLLPLRDGLTLIRRVGACANGS